MNRQHLAKAALACALAVAAAGAIAADPPPGDRAIEYRQNVFGLVGWNFSAMSQMVRGQRDWDAAEFTRRAERVAALSKMLDEGFTPGSDKGADTEALPAIWANLDDFNAKMADFGREADALAAAARAGDVDAAKAQFAKTGGTCKACHDEYKAD
jgi:cytochrome c556